MATHSKRTKFLEDITNICEDISEVDCESINISKVQFEKEKVYVSLDNDSEEENVLKVRKRKSVRLPSYSDESEEQQTEIAYDGTIWNEIKTGSSPGRKSKHTIFKQKIGPTGYAEKSIIKNVAVPPEVISVMNSFPILTHEYVLVNPAQAPLSEVSVAEYLIKRINQYGSLTAMVHSLTEETITYNDIVKQSIKVAEGLRLKGIKPGDVVAVCTENRFEYAPVVLGILAIGATCCPLNPIYNIEEFLHILSISKPKIIFSSPFVINVIQECKTRMPFIEEIIQFNMVDSNAECIAYENFVKNSGNLETFQFPKLNPDECVAFLFCSSGTTGLPKCVELTHSNFNCFLDFIWIFLGNESTRKVTLGLIPFFHGYGCGMCIGSLLSKSLIVIMMRFDEENFLNSIQKYKITHLCLVPPLVVFLSKHPLVPKYDLSSIEKIICGAAPLSRETQIEAQKRLKLNFDIQQGYGMTELSIACVGFQSDVNKMGSSGTIAPGMECKVVDLSTGKALPPHERGELCFRGPFVMKGYRNNPKATKESFDSEGWFHTGDIAYYDEDGFLFIVDRLKELIKYKGFQVPPAELETILLNHPAIKEAGVIGIPDESAGELPLAFVVLQPGAKITEKEIQNYIAGKVSPQKRLHGGVRFINEIPKNISGKILRKELRLLLNNSKL